MFAYLDEESALKEHWQTSLETEEEQIIPDADADESEIFIEEEIVPEIAETPEPEDQEVAGPYLESLDELEFADAAERFKYRQDISIIWHQAWVEEIQSAEEAILHDVAVEIENDLKVTVNGTVRLHRSRYIHITPDLDIQQYVLGFPLEELPEEETIETPETEVPVADQSAPVSPFDHLYKKEEPVELSQPEVEVIPEEPVWMPLRAAHIDRSRRMRSDETHYLDHPLLGMVVRVTPYELPEDSNAGTDNTGTNNTEKKSGL